ncbi:MAG TPA: glycosyltransferase, partial [Candidatus Dormibacteraeota bacterium]|nr:glycosyltransferase [Candidatus Dormibacteraeota bacterium]
MKIAIVVLNWNQREATLACLDSLALADLQGAEVFVVDNGSRDGSVAALDDRLPPERLIALPENRGYAGGNNAGMRAALEAGAELVLLLNNDTTVSPDFLLPLLWALDGAPR